MKLSPDLSDDERAVLLDRLAASPARGVIVSNTTVTRPDVRHRLLAQEAGGLSGRPVRPMTLRAVERTVGRGLMVVASGGIGSADDARALVGAGADLVQLWTGMLYAGPGLIGDVVAATH